MARVVAGFVPVLVLGGCDVVFGMHMHDEAVSDASDDAPWDVVTEDVMLSPASCNAIHEAMPGAPSGTYMIDPDGAGGAPPLNVTCDMTTDGGGWTIVFVAPSINLASASIPYTTNAPQLLATAASTLIAYRDASLAALAGFASFAMPPEWRTDTPFDVAATDLPVVVSVDGGPTMSKTLRYGRQNFAALCGDSWMPGAQPLGRICVQGTTAPFYSGFITTATDRCTDSQSNYMTNPCTVDRQFSIAVR